MSFQGLLRALGFIFLVTLILYQSRKIRSEEESHLILSSERVENNTSKENNGTEDLFDEGTKRSNGLRIFLMGGCILFTIWLLIIRIAEPSLIAKYLISERLLWRVTGIFGMIFAFLGIFLIVYFGSVSDRTGQLVQELPTKYILISYAVDFILVGMVYYFSSTSFWNLPLWVHLVVLFIMFGLPLFVIRFVPSQGR